MWITLFLVIVLYFLIYGLLPAILLPYKEPPKSVGAVAMVEGIWGTLILSALWFIDFENKCLVKTILLLSLFWICVAVSLFKASKVGKTICLILSIIRIPSIIGIPFSLFSVCKLYFSEESKDFFRKT